MRAYFTSRMDEKIRYSVIKASHQICLKKHWNEASGSSLRNDMEARKRYRRVKIQDGATLADVYIYLFVVSLNMQYVKWNSERLINNPLKFVSVIMNVK